MIKIFTTLVCILINSSFANASARVDLGDDVAIIGGGISGLAAARKLKKYDVPYKIFEGRTRLGGRVHTQSMGKSLAYEEGGTFVDSDHFEMISLAQELGIPLIKRGYGSKKVSVVYKGKLMNGKDLHAMLTDTHDKLSKTWNAKKKNKKVINGSILPLLKGLSDAGKRFIQTHYEDLSGVSIKKASARITPGLLAYLKRYAQLTEAHKQNVPAIFIDQQVYDYVIGGGSSKIIEGMKQSLDDGDILLNHKLTQLTKEDDKYAMTFQHGDTQKTVTAKKIIMTLPFSTLRNVAIDGTVSLTSLQKRAIKTLPYGTNSKIGTIVPRGITNQMLFYINLDVTQMGWAGIGDGALTLMISGTEGKKVNKANATKITKKMAKGPFATIKGTKPVIKAGSVYFKNWSTDPFSLGSYTGYGHMDLYSLSKESKKTGYSGVEQFAEPIGGTLFFAGEHTRFDRYRGYMEGALISGNLAARSLCTSDNFLFLNLYKA